jgi:hypothetical protein
MLKHALAALFALGLGLCAEPLAAQHLRTGAMRSDAIVVGRTVGVRPLGSEFFVHTVEVIDVLRGELRAGDSFGIAVVRRASDQPTPAKDTAVRIFCLQHDPRGSSLPQNLGPWYRPSGYPGSHPALVADPNVEGSWNDDPSVRFVRLLLECEQGLAPTESASRVMEFAFSAHATTRLEAVRLLQERDVVRDALNDVQRTRIATRAVGETEDVEYKTALAMVAADFGIPNLVEDLCLGLDQVDDLEFARALGRIANQIHGEAATQRLITQRQSVRSEAVKQRLLVAIGATATKQALDTLLQMQQQQPGPFVEAALEAHGAPAAKEAVARAKKARETERR